MKYFERLILNYCKLESFQSQLSDIMYSLVLTFILIYILISRITILTKLTSDYCILDDFIMVYSLVTKCFMTFKSR